MKFTYFLREIWKKIQKKIEKFEKWFSGSVGTKQNQTQIVAKPEPNHNQMFFEFGTKPDPNRTEPKRTEISRNFNWYLWFDFGLISI